MFMHFSSPYYVMNIAYKTQTGDPAIVSTFNYFYIMES